MSKCSSCACDFEACCDRMAQLEAELAEAWRVAEIWRNDERAAHARTQAEAAVWKELHDRHCGAACCEGIDK